MPAAGWGSIVDRWRSSPRLQDGVTAAGTFAVGLVLLLFGLRGVWPFSGHGPSIAIGGHIGLLALGCLVLLGKRRRPLAALLAGLVVVGTDFALGGTIGMILVLFDLLFAVGLYASTRVRTAVMTAVFVTIGTASVVGGLALADVRMMLMIGLDLTGLLVIPLWWATNLRQQRELGEVNAARARQEAVDAERSSMARELHDVIATHLATTALHSGAALAQAPDAERDRAALRAVRTSSLAALEEMRSMILLLRAEGGDTIAPAGLGRLPALVEQARASGLDVQLDGDPPADLAALVDQAGYRIVHEALANAHKHAPGSRVDIGLATARDRLTVTVSNTLPPGRTSGAAALGHPALSAGSGLGNMAARAAQLGGQLSAGPDGAGPDGPLWMVRATLPLRPGAPA